MSFGGEKLLGAVEAFLAQWSPWVVLRVRPDGTLRFLDLRAFSNRTLTLGVDPVHPTPLSRDTAECYSRVLVRGAAIAEMFNFALSNGGLSEAPFAHDGLTVAQAKAAWTPADYRSPGLHPGQPGDDNGTYSCTSTTTVVVTSANPAMTWPANYLDQTSSGHQGTVFLSYSLGTSITTYATRAIVSNTALSAGGTSTLTLDRGLPHLNFDHYVITALTGGGVGRLVRLPVARLGGGEGGPPEHIPVRLPFRLGGSATSHMTTMRVSSRKAHFSAEAFLKPDRTGVTFGWSDEASLNLAPFGGLVGSGLSGVNVGDLPTPLGGMPNPGAGVPDLGGAFPNPGNAMVNPVSMDNSAYDRAADFMRARLGRQVFGMGDVDG